MAWSLQIHHIGLANSGDATLIIAENDGTGINQQPQIRSMLIDGGRVNECNYVDGYIATKLGDGVPLNVVVVTHYDIDHFNGVRALMAPGGRTIYHNVIIFDAGYSAGSSDNSYLLYISGINSGWAINAGQRARPTQYVYGLTGQPPKQDIQTGKPPAGGIPPADNWDAAGRLVGREIMWTDRAGAVVTPATLLGVAAGTNLNPPTVTCIAANQFVRGMNNSQGGNGTDLKNEHSLGFIIQFNNFKYYIAGDLETAQENAVQNTVNVANTLAGRVVAMHASHHGGNTSTSRAFIDRLKPDAVFISCGNANQHNHPSQEVVNVLGGYAWGAADHAAAPPPPPNRPVSYYLTGYQAVNLPPEDPKSLGEDGISRTAGNPQAVPRIPGDIVLSISLLQSNNDQRGEFYFGVREATRSAAQWAGAANAAAIGLAAANAVATTAGINSRQQAMLAALNAAAITIVPAPAAGVLVVAKNAAQFEASIAGPSGVNYTPGTIAHYTAQQTLNSGGTPMEAAIFGAAAGAAFASGERDSACIATREAILGAGLPKSTAFSAFLQCGAQIAQAVDVGLFNVSFYDYFQRPSGQVTITHTG